MFGLISARKHKKICVELHKQLRECKSDCAILKTINGELRRKLEKAEAESMMEETKQNELC